MKNQVQHILLIDDDHDDCELFGEALHDYDPSLKLSCLNNSEDVIRSLDEKMPDMVFLDVNMPRKNGYECLKEIRQHDKYTDIPIIMYSNTGRAEDISNAYKTGASIFIQKPSTYQGLVNTLKDVLQKDWAL
jgi:DNA-binding NtrC family response regulator